MSGPPPTVSHVWHGPTSMHRLLPMMNTGDLFFSRNRSLIGELIRWGTWDNYTHVMMADRVSADHLFVFESVRSVDGVYDLMTHQQRNGVRVCEADQRLRAMFAHQQQDQIQVCLIKLQVPNDQVRADIATRLHTFELSVAQREFEQQRLSMIAAQLPLLFGLNPQDESTFFCSELVAAAMRECGILPQELISSRYTPVMLSNAGRTFHRHWATPGVYYQPVVHHFVLCRSPDPAPVPATYQPSRPEAAPVYTPLAQLAEPTVPRPPAPRLDMFL